ncbi:phosphatidylglycerol lysyltransferase domain-containing protein [Mycobacterium sp. CVI_P3]|uniref:Phosphatidylglycerol lysyltransferase domain-containing protein n=1 Tax=Mycobacterium pinniadriaticum TaxID=2994102 RepID=A0ABT3SBB4_9MYCO|nr:phosphatidylglycerol lysyltransferase domain-containing protein [Mycobacterium pinniadriaticum]MCX2930128.1 phosphatidylglycerol lysyltransferase domain-containing protein [Mycobacterium pinniadriaticum]MCX2936810.1 phosphatidylglycerol lysyltransferase domain-containing protein [Mycobacterium pinniadriaticum]
MTEPPVQVALRLRARERVVVHVDTLAARWVGALALLIAASWLAVLVVRTHDHANWQADGRLAWSLTILAGVALIARGIFLGRPVTAAHAIAAAAAVLAGFAAHLLAFDFFGNVLIASSGLVLMWPTTARPEPGELARVWALVNATSGDPVAPFAMQMLKSYFFSADGTAAIAYRTRLGYAVVSGDPIGDEDRFDELVADFVGMCHAHGWRVVILGCSERRLGLWRDPAVIGQTLRPVPIGRDVVIDIPVFDMVGRRFRNLRQAVQRTHNFGITTEIVAEQEIDDGRLADLTDVLLSSPKGARTERGFSMILDGALTGRYPGIVLIIARDAAGRVQGFHRYALAGGGSDITLDVPWRRRGAPNGIDERLSVDMINAMREVGAQRLSLAFAAFPEIFRDKQRGPLSSFFYAAIHLGDSLIVLESLYRYLRKFHALGDRRYVLLPLAQVLPLLVVLLSLEFLPRRRQLPGATGPASG